MNEAVNIAEARDQRRSPRGAGKRDDRSLLDAPDPWLPQQLRLERIVGAVYSRAGGVGEGARVEGIECQPAHPVTEICPGFAEL